MRAEPVTVATPPRETQPVERMLEQSAGDRRGHAQPAKKRTPSNGLWIVIVLAGIALLQVLINVIGFTGLVVLIIIVVALLQWMRTLAKSSGRKTIRMPRDPRSSR